MYVKKTIACGAMSVTSSGQLAADRWLAGRRAEGGLGGLRMGLAELRWRPLSKKGVVDGLATGLNSIRSISEAPIGLIQKKQAQ